MKKTLALLLLCLPFSLLTIGQTTLSEKAVVTTRVIVLPPYPLSFHELMIKQGNAVVFQNLSANPQRINVNFNFSSLDASVSIATNRPVLSIDLAPYATQTFPLSQLVGGLSTASISCSGIGTDAVSTNRSLPEGYYTLCITPRSYYTNGYIGQEGCSATIPVMAIEPPTLRLANPTLNDTVLNTNSQNLLFQWNTPFGFSPSMIGTVKTILKVVEVPNGMTPTQAILSAPINSPNFTINGQNQFIYGPTLSPLIKGRRYAAVLQLSDIKNGVAFRNNGVSEVLTFVYGCQPSPILNNASTISGSVLWAYKAVEEIKATGNELLVSKTAIAERRQEIIKDNKVGKETYPLASALINVFGSDISPDKSGKGTPKVPIGTARTDENGRFILSLVLKQAMRKYNFITIEASHPLGMFSKAIKILPYKDIMNGTSLDPIVLAGQTMEFTPRVLLKDGSLNTDVSINVLFPEKQWAKYSFLADAALGTNRKTIAYNNQTYTVISTINNGNVYKKLFQTISPNEHYLVQVNCPNKPSAYYPLDNAFIESFDALGEKPIIEVAKNFVYDNTNKVSGKVFFEGKGIMDIRIEAFINPSDILGQYNPMAVYRAITENDGNYTIAGLPNLKSGAVIRFAITQKVLNNYPTKEELVVTNNIPLSKDFTITNSKITVKGHLVDKEGAPINYALVLVKGSNKTTHTDELGNYSIDVESTELQGQLQFRADGYVDTTIKVQAVVSRKIKDKAFLSTLDRGTTVLNEFTGNSTVQFSVVNFDDWSPVKKGTLTISSASGTISSIDVDLAKDNSNSFNFNFAGKYDPKGYTVSFSPASEDENLFAPVSIKVSLIKNQANRAIIFGTTTSSKTYSGTVKAYSYATLSYTPISQQLLTIANTTYQAVSDKNGRYQFNVPLDSIRIRASKPTYESADTLCRLAANNQIILRSTDKQFYKTLLGFPVTINSQKANIITPKVDSNYIISGFITVANNDIFSINGTSNLYFANLSVRPDASKNNGYPDLSNTVNLTVSSLNLVAWNYAAVQVTSLMLQKQASTGADALIGKLIGKLTVYPTSPATSSAALPNATVGIASSNAVDSLNTIFAVAPTSTTVNPKTLGGTSAIASYPIYFNRNIGVSVAVPSNLNTSLYLYAGFLAPNGVTITTSGNYNAYMKFNEIQAVKVSGQASFNQMIKSFAFGNDYSIQTLIFNDSNNDTAITKLTLQKISATFTQINLGGINTSNIAWTFKGYLNLTTSTTLNKVLGFSSMTLPKVSNGYALSSSLTILVDDIIPLKGFTIGKASLTPIANISYSPAINSYNLGFGATFSNNSNTDGKSNPAFEAIKGQVTGCAIQVTLQTSNWGLFVAATVNKSLNLGAATINLGSFIFSLGSGVSLNYMDSVMLGLKLASEGLTYDPALSNTTTSDWAFGISGSVSFPEAKDMSGKGKVSKSALKWAGNAGGAIVLFAYQNSTFQVRVDTIFLTISTQTMTVDAGAQIIIDNVKKGFSMNCSIQLKSIENPANGDKLDGAFTFYKYNAGGIELGADILVTKKIKAGSVTFFSLGGGFHMNTTGTDKVYLVYITGQLGPTGVPQEVFYVDARFDFLFSSACNYVPIITGSGKAVVGDKFTVATANMTLDICNKYLLVTINSSNTITLPSPFKTVSLDATAILYGVAPSSNTEGGFFFAVDMSVNIPVILPDGKAGFAIGYNVSSSNQYLPTDIKARMASYVGNGTLTGMYVYAVTNNASTGNYSYSFYGVGAHLNWDLSNSFKLSFFANFGKPLITLSASYNTHLSGGFGIDLYAFSASLGGTMDASFNLTGSCWPTGFSLIGNGGASLQVYGGSSDAINMGCNSAEVTYGYQDICVPFCGCTSIPYPNGVKAKACLGAKISFGIESGTPPYISVGF